MKPLQHYTDQVNSPGKFEGEKLLTPYLYDCALNGDGEQIVYQEDGCGIWAVKFDLYCDELEHFNTIDDETTWILVEDSQGFVMTMTVDHFKNYIGPDMANELGNIDLL
jgi:hypothetical protein